MTGSSFFSPRRTLDQRRQAVTNLVDFLIKGGIADVTRTASTVIDEGRTRTLHRYYAPGTIEPVGLPVLLVPPLGAQAAAFDLRRGCSLAEHLVDSGRRVYLVDYGDPSGPDRKLGIEHWVDDVLPEAIRKVSDDAGGIPVVLVGWCMGGLISLSTVAAFPDLPVRSVAMVASPFDLSKNPMLKPLQAAGRLTGGRVVGTGLKVMGSVPTGLVSVGFKATAFTTYLKKPATIWKRRDDRSFLAQVAAVDGLMNNMLTFPGGASMQAYYQLAIRNELASGKIQWATRLLDLADVRVPVMNVAGLSDVLAPKAAVHHVGDLLPNSPDVRLPEAPGGHLGVLTGPRARESTWAYLDKFLDDHA